MLFKTTEGRRTLLQMKEPRGGRRHGCLYVQLGLSQHLAGFKPHNSSMENKKWAHSFLVRDGGLFAIAIDDWRKPVFPL